LRILLYTTYFLLGVFYYLKSTGMFFILKELQLLTSERGEDCCLLEFDALYFSTYVQMGKSTLMTKAAVHHKTILVTESQSRPT